MSSASPRFRIVLSLIVPLVMYHFFDAFIFVERCKMITCFPPANLAHAGPGGEIVDRVWIHSLHSSTASKRWDNLALQCSV